MFLEGGGQREGEGGSEKAKESEELGGRVSKVCLSVGGGGVEVCM